MRIQNTIPLLFVVLLGGCAIALPFNERLSYQYEDRAKALNAPNIGAIAVRWIPQDFPSRSMYRAPPVLLGVVHEQECQPESRCQQELNTSLIKLLESTLVQAMC